jgi:hypothetical protein
VLRRLWNLFLTIVVLGLIGGGLYIYWDLDYRWRPHVITKHVDEIGKILDASGWVSPGLTGPKLYEITYRGSPDGVRFEQSQFPDLHQAGVDTRVIVIARADENGAPKSTAIERNTVAELWFNRSWKLYQTWSQTAAGDWTAPGIPPADGNVARSAVVEAGRDMVERLTPLLRDNGIGGAFPTLIWWTKDGKMEGCACDRTETYKFVRKELGAG